jgi:hypothetical protein
MIRRAILANAVAILFALGWAASAEAAAWWEKNFWLSGPRYDNMVPLCQDPAVLGEIRARFAEKERRFWQSKLEILGFERIQQTAANPWRGAPDSIPRRYCSGVALVSDARPRSIHYWIGEDTGWLGASWGVEWGVVGLDRNWAYNPRCQMARP